MQEQSAFQLNRLLFDLIKACYRFRLDACLTQMNLIKLIFNIFPSNLTFLLPSGLDLFSPLRIQPVQLFLYPGVYLMPIVL